MLPFRASRLLLLFFHIINPNPKSKRKKMKSSAMADEDDDDAGSQSNHSNICLPLDATIEILSRLSLISISRVRLTCKLWNSITTDPHFLDSRLRRSLRSLPPNIALASRGQILINSTAGEILRPKPFGGRIRSLHGSCNGLLCISAVEGIGGVKLLNPTTGESLTPPKPSDAMFKAYYLGFHPATKEYKIIHLYSQDLIIPEISCELYTIGTGAWRHINAQSAEPMHKKIKDDDACRTTVVNGAVYWALGRRRASILSLDLKDEGFAAVSPPNSRVFDSPFVHFSLVEMEGSVGLVLFGAEEPKTQVDVWIMSGGDERVWTYKYSLLLPWPGRCLFHWDSYFYLLEAIYVHKEMVLVQIGMQLRLYDLKSESGSFKEVRVDELITEFHPHVHVHAHVESLIALRSH